MSWAASPPLSRRALRRRANHEAEGAELHRGLLGLAALREDQAASGPPAQLQAASARAAARVAHPQRAGGRVSRWRACARPPRRTRWGAAQQETARRRRAAPPALRYGRSNLRGTEGGSRRSSAVRLEPGQRHSLGPGGRRADLPAREGGNGARPGDREVVDRQQVVLEDNFRPTSAKPEAASHGPRECEGSAASAAQGGGESHWMAELELLASALSSRARDRSGVPACVPSRRHERRDPPGPIRTPW